MEGSYKCGEDTISVDTGVIKIEQSSVCDKQKNGYWYFLLTTCPWLGLLLQLNKDFRPYRGDSSEESFDKPSECAFHQSLLYNSL